MLEKIKVCYASISKLISADGIIPSGEAMLKARELGIANIHSDTAHASRGIGRYILALTWFKKLTGKESVSGNAFFDFDIPVSEEERQIAIKAVNETVI